MGGAESSGGMRWALLLLLGLALTAVLFLILGWIIRSPSLERDDAPMIEQVRLQPPKPELEKPSEVIDLAENSPPPPPAAPAAMGRPDLPELDIPTLAIDTVEVANVSVPVALGDSAGMSLGRSGTFGGFGSGSGRGTGGSGAGAGWTGKPLVPLSTARPQMPDWACDQKLNGWVEAIFTVMPNGRVQDVRIVDADPRGVFEAAAIASISHWIYAPTKTANEVKQKVPMNHEDCAYNW